MGLSSQIAMRQDMSCLPFHIWITFKSFIVTFILTSFVTFQALEIPTSIPFFLDTVSLAFNRSCMIKYSC